MFYWFLLDDNVNQSSVTLIASLLGVPGGSVVENLPASAGDVGLTPGLGRSPGEGEGYPLSILAWRIQAIQSMGSQRVRHN